MRDWKPPLKPDPWYAHIFRVLLRLNSRRRMKKMAQEDREFTWHYTLLKRTVGGESVYQVCEEYEGIGYSGACTPLGDTPEELLRELEMMADDIRGAIAHKDEIVEGQEYDDWRLQRLRNEETIPWEGFSEEELEELIDRDGFGDMDTVPVAKAFCEDDEE